MRLVTSIMSSHKLLEEDKNKIIKLFSNEYPYRMETYTFHYDERNIMNLILIYSM